MIEIDVVEELKTLIRMESTNPGAYETEIISYIKQYCKSHRLKYELIGVEGRKNLIVYVAGKTDKIIVLNGHVDTKPVGVYKQWESNPLIPYEKDGYLYGLGASDMKGGLSSILSLLKMITENSLCPMYTLEFHFVVDEENNSRYGTNYLLEQDSFKNKNYEMVIVCEPTENNFVERSLGNRWVTINILGVKAHAGKYFLGKSAPLELVRILNQLIEFTNSLKERDVDFPQFPNINIGILYGGDHPGTVQGQASATIDIRVFDEKDKITIINYLDKLIAESTFKINYTDYAPQMISWGNKENILEEYNSNYLEIKKVIQQTTLNTNKGLFFGGSDAGYYSDISKNICIFGPGSLEYAHQPNEKILLSELHQHYKALLRALVRI